LKNKVSGIIIFTIKGRAEMNKDMDLQHFINGCIAVEETTASIYKIFMDIFPEERDFWQDIYRDELEHSFWLTSGSRSEVIELLPANKPLPSMEHITSTLHFIEGKIAYVKKNPISLETALRTALKIEETMVEVFTNEITANLLATDDETLNNKLIAAEKIHINKIEDMMISRGFMQLS
jgi:hypothetical protein